MRDGTEQNDARKVFAVWLKSARFLDEVDQFFAVLVGFLCACVGLVVAKEGENDVRFDVFQDVVIGGDAFAPGEAIDAVSAEAHVSDSELGTLGLALKERFQPTVRVHPVGECVSHKRNSVALSESEGRGVSVFRWDCNSGGGFRWFWGRRFCCGL